MYLVLLFFILLGVLVYPVTLRIAVAEGQAHLYWLPRLFASYAPPVEIRLKKRSSQQKHQRQHKKKPKKPLRHKLRFALDVIGATHLEKLWFYGLLFCPGVSSFKAECIISVTACDIIGRVLRRIWRKKWRR